jgi:hypothetical protein
MPLLSRPADGIPQKVTTIVVERGQTLPEIILFTALQYLKMRYRKK